MAIACDRVRDLAPGFVLGALDPAEMAAVREHLRSCSRRHPELHELGGVVSYIGGSLSPVEPPARLKAAVLAAAQADLRARPGRKTVSDEVAPAVPEAVPVLAVVEGGRSAGIMSLAPARASRIRRAGVWVTRIAAAVAIVGLVGYAVVLQGDLTRAHTALDNTAKVYNSIGQPGAHSVVLTPPTGQKGAGDAVLLPSGHVYLNLHSLDATTGDEVYMVWLRADGGAVTKGGWFTVDDLGEGYLEMDNVPPSDSLWLMVCEEPNSGVGEPTGPVIVTGTIWVYPPPTTAPTF
ncbi:MAG: zf-HC2 domain-containing protein [Candidatus Limnocylindrales bacterium]|jgi:hypothetical protein